MDFQVKLQPKEPNLPFNPRPNSDQNDVLVQARSVTQVIVL